MFLLPHLRFVADYLINTASWFKRQAFYVKHSHVTKLKK